MRGNNSAVRKAAERQGRVMAVCEDHQPYVSLALAILSLAAEDAARGDDAEASVRARSWLQRIARGEPGWWNQIPGFDSRAFAVRVLGLTRPAHTPPTHSVLCQGTRYERERYEQSMLLFAS